MLHSAFTAIQELSPLSDTLHMKLWEEFTGVPMGRQ